jgi:hydroxypyruvate isomerase
MALRYCVNLSMLYTEHPFLDRFSKAARSGFTAVEYLFPYEFDRKELQFRLRDSGLTQALFNLHPGDTNLGEWGSLSNPAKRDYFRWSLTEALEFANVLGCFSLNAMIGKRIAGVERSAQVDCATQNLAWAAPLAQQAGVTLLLEPLNAVDFPGCVLSNTVEAIQLVRQAAHPNVKLQYDLYHSQMTEGNLIQTMTNSIASIGHIQLADVPGRHQPGTGEINYPMVLQALSEMPYSGYVGLEYRPSGESDASLTWLPREARSSA